MVRFDEPSEWTVFTFVPGLDLRRLCDVVRSVEIGFRPTEVRIQALGAGGIKAPYDDAVWDTILATPEVYGFELETGGLGPRLGCSVLGTMTDLMVSAAPATKSLVAAVLELPGLLGGASGDGTDGRWQSETDPNHYRMWWNGPWEQLPHTVDEWGDEVLDVSGNPGRITEVAGMRLWPAQDLWFGPAASLVIDYAAIASLPIGRVSDLGGGRFHIRLWEDGASLDEIRRRQQALRDHLRYDEAAARQDEIRAALTAAQPDDPMLIVQRGTFPHGGTERFLQYFSAAKYPTTRSRAAWLNIKEFDDTNHEVHNQDIDLTTEPHPDLSP